MRMKPCCLQRSCRAVKQQFSRYCQQQKDVTHSRKDAVNFSVSCVERLCCDVVRSKKLTKTDVRTSQSDSDPCERTHHARKEWRCCKNFLYHVAQRCQLAVGSRCNQVENVLDLRRLSAFQTHQQPLVHGRPLIRLHSKTEVRKNTKCCCLVQSVLQNDTSDLTITS